MYIINQYTKIKFNSFIIYSLFLYIFLCILLFMHFVYVPGTVTNALLLLVTLTLTAPHINTIVPI